MRQNQISETGFAEDAAEFSEGPTDIFGHNHEHGPTQSRIIMS
jgi:hypothetical protein